MPTNALPIYKFFEHIAEESEDSEVVRQKTLQMKDSIVYLKP